MIRPDPEDDFEGWVKSVAREAMAAYQGIPPHLRRRYYLRSACEHLLSILDCDAPEVILSRACQRVARNAQLFEAEIPEEFRWEEPDDD